ncbi:MAG: type II secretion system GspH family protein [Lachnospiraceae bacterium]|nr:type II secretion system GspH family protein [Lachnospiraceae bacterium]
MKNCLKNNEGFSLVEMVVVVLIIAILAVALAPQVIKWIEHSRNSSDEQTKNTLLEYASFALTEEEAFKMVKDGEYEIHIVKDINGTTYTYMDKNGTHVGAANVDQTDPYWANLLKCVGVSSLEKLEEETRIKSTPEPDQPIEIEILVYIGGYTYGKLKGIENATLGIVNADS